MVENVTKNKFFAIDTNSFALRNLRKYVLNLRDIELNMIINVKLRKIYFKF